MDPSLEKEFDIYEQMQAEMDLEAERRYEKKMMNDQKERKAFLEAQRLEMNEKAYNILNNK